MVIRVRHPIMQAKAEMLADGDDRAGGGPAGGPTGTVVQVAPPLVRTHALDSGVNLISEAALGLLPNHHVGAGALQVRGKIGPRVGVDGVDGPKADLGVHLGGRVDATDSNLRGGGSEDRAPEGGGRGLSGSGRVPVPAAQTAQPARALRGAGGRLKAALALNLAQPAADETRGGEAALAPGLPSSWARSLDSSRVSGMTEASGRTLVASERDAWTSR